MKTLVKALMFSTLLGLMLPSIWIMLGTESFYLAFTPYRHICDIITFINWCTAISIISTAIEIIRD